MKSFHWFSLWAILFLSSFESVSFETPVGTFRLVHFFVAFCLIVSGAAVLKGAKRISKNVGSYTLFVIAFIYLIYGPFTLIYSYYPKGTITMALGQLCNVVIFFYCYGVLVIYPSFYARLPNLVVSNIQFQSILVVCHFFLIAFGIIPSGDAGYGIGGLGRPGAFFGDPNWFSEYVIVLFLMALYFYKDGRISHSKIMKLCCIISFDFILTESRVALIILVVTLYLFFFKPENRKVITITVIIPLFILILAIGGDVKSLLPSRFYYDLLDYQDNPRLNDINNLVTEITFYHRFQYGFGWGALPFIADTYYWRNYQGSINVMPVQILFDFGFTGLTIFTIIFFITLRRYKNRLLRFAFFTLMFFNIFHMSGYMQFYWVLLAFVLFLSRNEKSPIYNVRTTSRLIRRTLPQFEEDERKVAAAALLSS